MRTIGTLWTPNKKRTLILIWSVIFWNMSHLCMFTILFWKKNIMIWWGGYYERHFFFLWGPWDVMQLSVEKAHWSEWSILQQYKELFNNQWYVIAHTYSIVMQFPLLTMTILWWTWSHTWTHIHEYKHYPSKNSRTIQVSNDASAVVSVIHTDRWISVHAVH